MRVGWLWVQQDTALKEEEQFLEFILLNLPARMAVGSDSLFFSLCKGVKIYTYSSGSSTEESTWLWMYDLCLLLQWDTQQSLNVPDINVNYGYLTGTPEQQLLSSGEPGNQPVLGAVQTPQETKSLQQLSHSVRTSHVMPAAESYSSSLQLLVLQNFYC